MSPGGNFVYYLHNVMHDRGTTNRGTLSHSPIERSTRGTRIGIKNQIVLQVQYSELYCLANLPAVDTSFVVLN